MADLLRELEQEQLKDDLPDFGPGDTVRVLYLVREGEKERIQVFEGVCLRRRGGGMSASFTVRKVSGGVGVERVFPLHSPFVTGIEVVRRGRVRRAKLYYLRGLRGKAARIRIRKSALTDSSARCRGAITHQTRGTTSGLGTLSNTREGSGALVLLRLRASMRQGEDPWRVPW